MIDIEINAAREPQRRARIGIRFVNAPVIRPEQARHDERPHRHPPGFLLRLKFVAVIAAGLVDAGAPHEARPGAVIGFELLIKDNAR
jgi:hypothetical protein